MLLLADRNFAVKALFEAVTRHRRRACLSVCQDNRRLKPIQRCGTAPGLTRIGDLTLRVVEGRDPHPLRRRTGPDRPLPAPDHLTDHHRYPARDLVEL